MRGFHQHSNLLYLKIYFLNSSQKLSVYLLYCDKTGTYNLIMDIVRDCVNRLVSCGIADAEAWRIVKDFLKNYYGSKELIEFVEEKEKENVDRIQSKPSRCSCGGLCGSCNCKSS